MDLKDPESIKVLEALLFSIFAAIGGTLAYVLRALNNDEKPKIARGIVEGLSSGFVGLLAMLACKALGLNWMWSGVIVGVFGWLGAETSIMFLTRLVRVKLGLDNHHGSEDDKK